jgi:ABC-type multidrug transport system fused ATPase/permease subunit
VEKNPEWPSRGFLEIRDLRVSYNMSQVFILKGLTFTVPAGAKVGVVGRSGAGKTTLFSALSGNFDDYKGEIVLDSRELKSVDLKHWRAGITIVPQDPTLLSGTVRYNLDPFGVETDEKIIGMLTKLDLWQKFGQKGGLNCHIEVGGSNLSQGEKQLMCLCRGLIEKSKLVLIDEATASIDESMEQEVLTLMKEELAGCTVLTIAHRLNTVLNSDFILVMEDGRIVEFNRASILKSDPYSKFSTMIGAKRDSKEYLG